MNCLHSKAKSRPLFRRVVVQERKRLNESLQRLEALESGFGAQPRLIKTNGHRKPSRLGAKYRNPAKPIETWAGRGNRPRWLVAALKGGKEKARRFCRPRFQVIGYKALGCTGLVKGHWSRCAVCRIETQCFSQEMHQPAPLVA